MDETEVKKETDYVAAEDVNHARSAQLITRWAVAAADC